MRAIRNFGAIIMTFWKRKTLKEMNPEEWELLCDGCARCCLQKLEDEETGNMYYTCIVCKYLHENTCRCIRYEQRTILVPTCIKLSVQNLEGIHFLPQTCAYRLLDEGRELPWWHHLVSGSQSTVHEARISVRGKVISEEYVHAEDWQSNIIDWVL